MKNKLTYKEALLELKVLERDQRTSKKYRKLKGNIQFDIQYRIRDNKIKINYLLSIIHAHKTSRKMFSEIGMLSC